MCFFVLEKIILTFKFLFPSLSRRVYPSSLLLVYLFFLYLFISFMCVFLKLSVKFGEREKLLMKEEKRKKKNGENVSVCTIHCPAMCR